MSKTGKMQGKKRRPHSEQTFHAEIELINHPRTHRWTKGEQEQHITQTKGPILANMIHLKLLLRTQKLYTDQIEKKYFYMTWNIGMFYLGRIRFICKQFEISLRYERYAYGAAYYCCRKYAFYYNSILQNFSADWS